MEQEIFQELLKLLNDFMEIYDRELPYHINVIDELHADENSHSRIFAKILRFKKNNKFVFLESFLNDVAKFNLSVENPKIKKVDSCGRIDIPIFDEKYVVVIENKVTDKAADQNNEDGGQLARYIETMTDKKTYNRNINTIYVIYTPKYSREPSKRCWINEEGHSYKKEFEDRFCSLSYRDSIYPWLKEVILPKIENEDKYLKSAVEQYIDYLEGMFSLRTINNKMNMELQEFIKKELKLNGNPDNDLKTLFAETKVMEDALTQLNELQKKIISERFSQWEKRLLMDFPNYTIVKDIDPYSTQCIGIKRKMNDKEDKSSFSIGRHDSIFYYGIKRGYDDNNFSNVCDKDEFRNTLRWEKFKETSVEKAYENLTTLIKGV
jgi:hypothetical protein